ncbi:hypothetical protein L1885_06245, partial [Streptomyces fuscigenes]|nr:hypothetical protein [Streptomyces fuscigenes]
MTMSTVAAVLSGALAWAGRRHVRRARRRTSALLATERTGVRGGLRYPSGAWARRWIPPVGALLAAWVLVGGLPGAAVGLAAGVGLWRWSPLSRNGGRIVPADV